MEQIDMQKIGNFDGDTSNWVDGLPASDDVSAESSFTPKHKKAADTSGPGAYIEDCPDCRGGGRFMSWSGRDVGPCFKCKGKGKLRFKNSKEVRKQQRALREARKIKKALTAEADFQRDHPVRWAWLQANSHKDFAGSLLRAIPKYGKLTDKQLTAIDSSIEREEGWKREREDRDVNATAVDVSRITKAFQTAQESGLKWPKLRLGDFLLSLAGANSRNAGAIYIKTGGTYLGKIMDGRFTQSRDCTDQNEADIVVACADPEAAAFAHGLMTGSCSCCGRELTKKESVDRGIGPICASKWGW